MSYDDNARKYAQEALGKIERVEAILKLAGIGFPEADIQAEINDRRKRLARKAKIKARKAWLEKADRWMVEHWRTAFKRNYRRLREQRRAAA